MQFLEWKMVEDKFDVVGSGKLETHFSSVDYISCVWRRSVLNLQAY